MRTRRPRPAPAARSAFAGFRFPPDVIVVAVRWYLRFGLSYRDVEELLAERGVEVDHVTVYRWVQRFTPLLAQAARPCRHAVGDRWFVDETYVKVAGQWRCVYRAIDQFDQVMDVVMDVVVSVRRDTVAAHRFFERAVGTTKVVPVEVVTDRAATYPIVLEELLPAAWHRTERYANNRVEADHGRLKARLRPMRGLKQDRTARVVIAGHGFVQDSDEATTSWPPRSRRVGGWQSPSPSLRSHSDPELCRAFNKPRVGTTQQTAGAPVHGAGMMQVGDSDVVSTVEKGVRHPGPGGAPVNTPNRPVYIDDRGGAKAPPNDRERRRDARSAGALRDPGRRHRPGTPVLGLPLRVAVRGLPGSVRVPHDPDQRSGGVAITNMEPGKRGIRPYFDVDDINAGAARVKELGGEANDPGSVPGMGWFATCRDPQGNEFGLWQNDPSAPDTTG
jgi:transposase-like protein/predicted enzyme related to lactoylglutathione lyase